MKETDIEYEIVRRSAQEEILLVVEENPNDLPKILALVREKLNKATKINLGYFN